MTRLEKDLWMSTNVLKNSAQEEVSEVFFFIIIYFLFIQLLWSLSITLLVTAILY